MCTRARWKVQMKTYGGPARPDAEVDNGLMKISVVQAACFLWGETEQIYLASSTPWPPRDHLKEKDLSWVCKYLPKGFSERKNGSSAVDQGFVDWWPVNLRLTFRTVRTHKKRSHSTSVLGWTNRPHFRGQRSLQPQAPRTWYLTMPLGSHQSYTKLHLESWRDFQTPVGSALLHSSQPSPGCLRDVVWNGCTVCTARLYMPARLAGFASLVLFQTSSGPRLPKFQQKCTNQRCFIPSCWTSSKFRISCCQLSSWGAEDL